MTLTFQEALCKNVLLLPMGIASAAPYNDHSGRADDGAHSTNEKIDISNYLGGIKLLSTYLHELV